MCKSNRARHAQCVCVSVISSSSASREREVYRAKGERGRGLVPRTDFAFSLAATFDTCYAFVCCPSRGRGQRRGSPLFPFYCVLKYLHNENEAFPYTHTNTHAYACVCLCVFMSVCPNTLFFGALACLIYERCCVCLLLLLLLPCVVVVVLLVPAVLLFLLLTQSYTYDMIFYTRLPIMTC